MAARTQIEADAQRVLALLVGIGQITKWLSGQEISDETGLEPPRINDAVSLLEFNGFAETMRTMGTAPFEFSEVWATALGKREAQRATLRQKLSPEDAPTDDAPDMAALSRFPAPVGSPYGFTEEDWEYVESERARISVLKVVVGYQFNSGHFDLNRLMKMLRRDFQAAVNEYNRETGNEPARLSLRRLRAGYGEHLFNEIARDVISADIAVFETSDKNPNVMIEMGVALTWGRRVLPIKKKGRPRPPSDISGQTWADYDATTYRFVGDDHHDSLVAMVRRVLRRKAST